MNLLESFEWKGYFYIPNYGEEELPGILKFSQSEGIQLDLFGRFDQSAKARSTSKTIIVGTSASGKRVTLLDCFQVSISMGFPGFPQSTFHAVYLLIGEQYNSYESLLFQHLRFTVKDANSWSTVTGFQKVAYNEDTKTTTISYSTLQEQSFKIDGGFSLELEFASRRPIEGFAPKDKASIEQTCYFIISSDDGSVSFERLLAQWGIFMSFLSLCYFTYPIVIEHQLMGFYDDKKIAIECYYSLGTDIDKYKQKDDENLFLLTYKEMEKGFPAIIQKWYEIYKQADASIASLTEVFMQRSSAIEFKFLSLAQALENFHRKLRNRTFLSTEKHAQIIDELEKTIGDYLPDWEHTEWLNNLLKYSNELRFHSRLKDLSKSLSKTLRKVLFKSESRFIRKVTENRNYYTHYSEDLKSKKASLSKLFVLSEIAKIFLIALLLDELTSDKKKVEEVIIKKSFLLYNHIINYDTGKDLVDWGTDISI